MNRWIFYVKGNCSAVLGHRRMFSAKAVCTDCVSRYSTFLFENIKFGNTEFSGFPDSAYLLVAQTA